MTVVLLVWLACAALCAYIAAQRGLNVGRWALAGLIFGVFAVAAVCLTGTRAKQAAQWSHHTGDPEGVQRWHDGDMWTHKTRLGP